ncbi:NAD(FAD)-utilizing dehydrogenase RecQ [Dehalogenimonas sp. WBC-2]|nr:NAD(FAD)-utilizing dehydrogenase RecQ [Dehalogenimonas sp. WBC-2]
MSKYDVVIIGGGPAGLFAALELVTDKALRIILLEKGRDIDERSNIVSGLGGAGAFSDGKLTLSSKAGGHLAEYVGETAAEDLIRYVDKLWLDFGAPEKIYGMGEGVADIERRASLAGLRLVPLPVRHLGTERCPAVLRAIRDHLQKRIEIRVNTAAKQIIASEGKVIGVETAEGEVIESETVIVAPGREGSDWLLKQARALGLSLATNPVDVGVRVELPNAVLESLTSVLYEAKLEFLSKSFDDRIRTFCMCPQGTVVKETTGGDDPVITVNGQSFASHDSPNTNFALLVSTQFTEPFKEPIEYGKYIARLANILSGGVLVQRLGDLKKGRRSTPERIARGLVRPTLADATPGDLSFVVPYRHLTGLLEMLDAMDKLSPGVASEHTLLYGVEVKFYSSRPKLSSGFETELAGLFAIGDGAGISRGLIQASACGVVAAREILRKR